jgi:c-di-GMP-binding flagellar brake protein YcgR
MIDQPDELIVGEQVAGMLRVLVDSKQLCRIEVPETGYGWFTLLLGVWSEKRSRYLSIENVEGFEKALAHAPEKQVSLEFSEKNGIRCHFKAQVLQCSPDEIRATWPDAICRAQRRAFFRIDAVSGTEITFRLTPGKEEKAVVKDYSLGGVAFLADRGLEMKMGDRVTQIELRLPYQSGARTIHIASGTIRRIEPPSKGKRLYAIEFMEYPEKTREMLRSHIAQTQRWLIRKTKRT